MKQKFNKKLVFNKSTVTNLNGPEMSVVRGGLDTNVSCPVTFNPAVCVPTVDVSNCASNCVCGTAGPDCLTAKCQ